MQKYRKYILGRLFLVLGLILLIPTGIIFQILRINVVRGEQLRELWSAQAIDYIPIPAQRGSILDANGNIMVTNTVAYTVAVDPIYRTMNSAKIDTICHILSHYSSYSKEYYLRKIKLAPNGSRYVVLGKNFGLNVYQSLYTLNFSGLILEEQYKRRYNYDSLAAHVVGFVNHNAIGMTGLENYYENYLKGEDGSQQIQRDRNNRIRAIIGVPKKKPEHGYNLKTTIDVHIQAIVEEELRRGAVKHKANKAVAIVMDPYTGAIKAMANYPSFNPNRIGVTDDENRRNYAVSDMIEPGSTFKVITALAAVDQKTVKMDEIFETPESGMKLIYGQWMRDHDPLGNLTFREVFSKSSNVATADIAMRFNKNDFYQNIRNLGFGNKTNIDLPNEVDGKLKRPHEWSQVSLPWMSVGYEILVTPLQLTQAYAAIANGGDLMQPFVVEEITNNENNIIYKHKLTKVRTVANQSTLETLLPIFESVVSDSGTANLAQIDGMTIAGKTGTAQKYFDGKYRTRYNASFIGFFPSRQPRYVCFILMDEPKTSIYGGTTAAPVFKQIALRLIGFDEELQRVYERDEKEHFAVLPNVTGYSKEEAEKLLKSLKLSVEFNGNGDTIASQEPNAGTILEFSQSILLITDSPAKIDEATTLLSVPDLSGLSMRDATELLLRHGLNFTKVGSGTVFAQYPKSGEKVKQGQRITVRGRALPLESLTGVKK